MATLTITAANVSSGIDSISHISYQGSAVITAGQAVVLDTEANTVGVADWSTAANATVLGIALTGCSGAGAYCLVASGSDIVSGGTMVAGTTYYLGATGTIVEYADITTGKYITSLFRARSTTVCKMGIDVTGIAAL